VALVRRVIDRFTIVDGPLLASGIAFNAVFALIPLALLLSGIAGLVLSDPAARQDVVSTISELFPPLAPIVDQILAGLNQTSTTATVIGLVIAGWGTSRMFASLASAVVQLETTSRRRSFVRTTVRRIGSILVVAGILLLSLVLTPILNILRDLSDDHSVGTTVLGIVTLVLPIALATVALAVVYRVTPIVRPSWRAIAVPAVIGAVALDILSRGFVFFAPRVFAGNVVYGTLGAILVGLVWLQLVFMIILIGAAWTIERSLAAAGAASTAPASNDPGAPPPV
jgi:membrane protein